MAQSKWSTIHNNKKNGKKRRANLEGGEMSTQTEQKVQDKGERKEKGKWQHKRTEEQRTSQRRRKCQSKG